MHSTASVAVSEWLGGLPMGHNRKAGVKVLGQLVTGWVAC